ncbi:hypothetical protein RHRU231_850047 [Rhodococcus ruber]|uniref:Uncharacterized protein n=1 Tax=Rhodococcus ruber TaxID=1830 RepID=A0A098BTL1_9NOCA|nr:hypothetical protein TN91_11095 [Rhodococcus ruber]CDZ91587.1 hypothetical protein RHRU231_850047 [Rhodococcus ruber]
MTEVAEPGGAAHVTAWAGGAATSAAATPATTTAPPPSTRTDFRASATTDTVTASSGLVPRKPNPLRGVYGDAHRFTGWAGIDAVTGRHRSGDYAQRNA